MAWRYEQASGDLYRDAKLIGRGYSGSGHSIDQGRDNPAMQDVVGHGPIPLGAWSIGKPINSAKLGPLALPLTHVSGEAFGRSGFYIHGDNAADDASHGCIILGRIFRVMIAESGDTDLQVF